MLEKNIYKLSTLDHKHTYKSNISHCIPLCDLQSVLMDERPKPLQESRQEMEERSIEEQKEDDTC